MANKETCTAIFFLSLVGSSLCVIPEGEIQIGPLFGKGSRIFAGTKHIEAVFEKGAHLKPLFAKKVLIGVGALGAGALAAGGAALLAKKLPHLHHGGWGWSPASSYSHGYDQSQYNAVASPSYGWAGNGGQYQQAASGTIKYPSSYPSSYPTVSSSYDSSSYSNYPSTNYGYPEQSGWQGSDSYEGSYGWSG